MNCIQCKSPIKVFGCAKHSKSNSNSKIFLKTFYLVICLKNYISLFSHEALMNNQRKLMFKKNYCLWTRFPTRCSECDLNYMANLCCNIALGTTQLSWWWPPEEWVQWKVCPPLQEWHFLLFNLILFLFCSRQVPNPLIPSFCLLYR